MWTRQDKTACENSRLTPEGGLKATRCLDKTETRQDKIILVPVHWPKLERCQFTGHHASAVSLFKITQVTWTSCSRTMEKLSAKSLQILLLAEHLRMRLHSERDCPMVRDRRYHLRTYPCCFVGRELVDWLVKHGEASSRAVAVQCMCILQENGLIHHGN